MIRKVSMLIAILTLSSLQGLRANETPQAYRMIAQEQGVPALLFYAVALTESGQSSRSRNQLRPWPWTLNVAGKGQYFPTRKAAWWALQHALDSGERSVDIGLMQVSWRYHRAALESAWQALDPYHNLRVAAAILHNCLVEHTDWMRSAGCYHAPNDSVRAQAYASRVKRHWRQLGAFQQEARHEQR